jgi:hypothetical protein
MVRKGMLLLAFYEEVALARNLLAYELPEGVG